MLNEHTWLLVCYNTGISWKHIWCRAVFLPSNSTTVCGSTHLQLLVKAPWSAQGGVEGMGPVCGPQDQQLTWVTLLEGQEKRRNQSCLESQWEHCVYMECLNHLAIRTPINVYFFKKEVNIHVNISVVLMLLQATQYHWKLYLRYFSSENPLKLKCVCPLTQLW